MFFSIMLSLFVFLGFNFPCQASFQVKNLTLEEKIGQLLMAHFNGDTANTDAATLIREGKVGAIIYYNWANDLTYPEKVRTLSENLQNIALKNPTPIPFFIAADQEGGLVTRIKGLTQFPGNKAQGVAGDIKLTEYSAFAMGLELRTVGVNMNLAPVVDINCNPQNPVIGIRSFGSDPEKVIVFGGKALLGFKQAEIITALKHFPGHGDVFCDSHYALPCVNKSLEELRNNELKPFATLAKNAEVIMTGHLLFPALDDKNCTTLSKKSLDFLRQDLGYNGIIVSDSLVMNSIVNQTNSIEEASIKAFNAGCDIICLGGKDLLGSNNITLEITPKDIVKIHKALVQAVLDGHISMERVDESVERILELKNRYKLIKNYPENLDFEKHQAISSKIATLALKESSVAPLNPIKEIKSKKIALVAPKAIKENIRMGALPNLSNRTSLTFYSEQAPTLKELNKIYRAINEADLVIFCSYNAWRYPQQASLMAKATKDKHSVLVVLRDSLDISLAPHAEMILETFSPSAPSLQAVYERLVGL